MQIKTDKNFKELQPANAEKAIELCVIANRILANEGILDAFGHVSIRNPEKPTSFFQSAQMPCELVTRDDILEIDLDGQILSRKTDGEPFLELAMHGEIYRARNDVHAICHTHARELVPFAVTGTPIRPLTQNSGMFYDGVPVHDSEKVSRGLLMEKKTECLALIKTLGSHRAVLVRHHGAVVVGENIFNMVASSIFLRDNAIMQTEAMKMGEPHYLSEEEGIEAMNYVLVPMRSKKTWEYWLGRARRVMPDMYW